LPCRYTSTGLARFRSASFTCSIASHRTPAHGMLPATLLVLGAVESRFRMPSLCFPSLLSALCFPFRLLRDCSVYYPVVNCLPTASDDPLEPLLHCSCDRTAGGRLGHRYTTRLPPVTAHTNTVDDRGDGLPSFQWLVDGDRDQGACRAIRVR